MNATQNEKAARFRALHDGPGAFVIPGVRWSLTFILLPNRPRTAQN